MALFVAQTIAGLVVLSVASDRFVLAAARLARLLGLSALVVGAVVLGVGTSLPEFTVTAMAAAGGAPALGLSNAVGSNVANTTLVLGAAAIVAPVQTNRRRVRREGLLALLACAALALACADGVLSPGDGRALALAGFAGLVALGWIARADAEVGPTQPGDAAAPPPNAPPPAPAAGRGRLALRSAAAAALGLAGVLLGAHWMVAGAGGLARAVGLSDAVVGLTVVAVGTSLPELASSVAASRRGAPDLVFGNVLGSNLFNATFVAAAAAWRGPVRADPTVLEGSGVMVVAALAAGLFAWTAHRIDRLEGALLLLAFALSVARSFGAW